MRTLSVIIPAYNAKNHISIAIDSLQKQSLKIDEIIVVDDGSTDGTLEYVHKHYPKVITYAQHNSGPSVARNFGVKNATSQYISFLDADDEWDKNMWLTANQFFKKNSDINWWYSNFSLNSWKNKRNKFTTSKILKNPIYYYSRNYKMCTGSVFLKKTTFENLNGYNHNLRAGEDIDLWLRLCLENPLCGYEAKPLMKYNNINRDSITSTMDLETERAIQKKYLLLEDYPLKYKKEIFYFFKKKYQKELLVAYLNNDERFLSQIKKELIEYKLNIGPHFVLKVLAKSLYIIKSNL